MPKLHIAITLQSSDRAGIVSEMADIIRKHEGNWLDSQMVQLAGLFTGIVTALLPEEQLHKLDNALQLLKDTDIHTQLRVLQQAETEAEAQTQSVPFDLSGPDRIGIISEISRMFHQLGMNIESIRTHTENAAWSGEDVFYAEGTVSLPPAPAIESLSAKINQLEDSTGVDLNLDLSNIQSK